MVESQFVTSSENRQLECQEGVTFNLDAATPRALGQSDGNGRLAFGTDGINLETELVETARSNTAGMSVRMP